MFHILIHKMRLDLLYMSTLFVQVTTFWKLKFDMTRSLYLFELGRYARHCADATYHQLILKCDPSAGCRVYNCIVLRKGGTYVNIYRCLCIETITFIACFWALWRHFFIKRVTDNTSSYCLFAIVFYLVIYFSIAYDSSHWLWCDFMWRKIKYSNV